MKNKPSFLKLLFLSSFICIFSLTAVAQNKKISIQGLLKDANGKAVEDGSYPITFKLYNGAASVTPLWTEVLSEVSVSGGIYTVQLGGTNSITALPWDEPYFLGITIQGTELSPRTELTYAPYAIAVATANTVSCSGAIGDVKYSILDPTQFADVNGSCWVPMDGRSIAGSELETITSMATIPDVGGLFLRSQEFSGGADQDPNRTFSSPIATLQEDDFKSHDHDGSALTATGSTSTGGAHTHTYSNGTQQGSETDSGTDEKYQRPNNTTGLTSSSGNHSHTVTITVAGNVSLNGGDETRPKNLNLWTYIRIN
jgi:hypothetical protein